MDAPGIVGRFAPTPSGLLHRGSVLAAIGSYLLARASKGRWLLRMEDLDTPRLQAGADSAILRDLERLGLEWDGPVLYQSTRIPAYAEALAQLQRQGLAYPCACTRQEIRLAGGIYPGTCRNGLPADRQGRAWRLRVPEQPRVFHDLLLGPQRQFPALEGDFILQRADGIFAYVLASVVDDAWQGVTQVARGEDLLAVTGRQCLLQDYLGHGRPVYAHLPLILDGQGRKLSKSDGASPWAEAPARAWMSALTDLGVPLPADLSGADMPTLRAFALDHFARRLPAMPNQSFNRTLRYD
ncbi:tRNA glutamyl-Q(34) synthetase GluQRS [Thermithiobacillus plumbiphilus]|uniref:Glutamyl-Q tRNA(Asp) synthetase n=1 Tax=Thermithiobacillus plumbiphilus TaxID=1729899 RepID=A0ABU9D6F8_9PROT